jgi:hypothetical protein
MTIKEVLEPIFHEVFDDDEIELREDMTADDVVAGTPFHMST